MATIPVNGTELYYEESGHGPAVLFIHGMCGNADTWQDQRRRLAAHFRCVAYDRRGHTRSPLGDVAQRTVELHADDAATLIQALGLAPCLVVGSSGGARIALDVARRYPALLSGAVLSEPPVFALDPEGAADFVGPLKPRIEQAVTTGGPRAAVDAFFGLVCPGIWNVLDNTRRDAFRDNAAELFGDLQMPPYAITPADLRAFTVPGRIICGDRSHPVFRRIAQVLAAQLPGTELVELAASGHVTYFEQPDAFARAVTAFAAGLPAAPRAPVGQAAGA